MKPKIFVSRHEANDEPYYERLQGICSEQLDLWTDRSLRAGDRVNSYQSNYILRRIRDRYVKGTSCTIVLLGRDSINRKFIDWEIKATLDAKHGLVGIQLPGDQIEPRDFWMPWRYWDNYNSGYAVTVSWHGLTAETLQLAINAAKLRSATLIDNGRPMMRQNNRPNDRYPR